MKGQAVEIRCGARLAGVTAALAIAKSEAEVAAALLADARALAGADGVALARREGEQVRYLAEDAIAPLWAGECFPIATCLSGTAMLQNRTILVPDIFSDLRVRAELYARTFVRSLVILPVGAVRPHLALGAYWAEAGPVDPRALETLSSLACSARLALERIRGGTWPRMRPRAA